MSELNQVYKCETDGLIVEGIHGSKGDATCCGTSTAQFMVASTRVIARAYCNIHGLWRAQS